MVSLYLKYKFGVFCIWLFLWCPVVIIQIWMWSFLYLTSELPRFCIWSFCVLFCRCISNMKMMFSVFDISIAVFEIRDAIFDLWDRISCMEKIIPWNWPVGSQSGVPGQLPAAPRRRVMMSRCVSPDRPFHPRLYIWPCPAMVFCWRGWKGPTRACAVSVYLALPFALHCALPVRAYLCRCMCVVCVRPCLNIISSRLDLEPLTCCQVDSTRQPSRVDSALNFNVRSTLLGKLSVESTWRNNPVESIRL
jgi:hypothetical protein